MIDKMMRIVYNESMDLVNRIIPVTDLRRRFGEITENLEMLGEIILTRDGRPFAILKAVPTEKRSKLLDLAGAWKNTEMDNEKIWKEVLTRKSRKNPINI
jgi:hypothetical protein